jgi:HxlR-like helix-turn-helix
MTIASMRSDYGQFCPVAKASEIFATRWTPLVVRELLFGSHAFNDIHRGVPLMSRALLVELGPCPYPGPHHRRRSRSGADDVDYAPAHRYGSAAGPSRRHPL